MLIYEKVWVREREGGVLKKINFELNEGSVL